MIGRQGDGDVPRVPAVPERDVVHGRVDELVLGTLALALPHAREPPGIERLCILIESLIVVHRVRRRSDRCALRDEGPVDEGQVLQCLATDGNWKMPSVGAKWDMGGV